MAIDILVLLHNRWCSFQYIAMLADWFTKPVQKLPLRGICLIEIAQSFLLDWNFKYRSLNLLLLDHRKNFTSRFLQFACQLLKSCCFSSIYQAPANLQLERYNQWLTAIMQCRTNPHDHGWDMYASALKNPSISQAHRSRNNRIYGLCIERGFRSFLWYKQPPL